MAANEFYDGVGEVLSYVLSAEDTIYRQVQITDGIYFQLVRDSTTLEFFANPSKRYFTLIYRFSITDTLAKAYGNNNQILRGHLERYDINDSTIRDDNLDDVVAYRRLGDVSEDDAEKVLNDVRSLSIHSGCRISSATTEHPTKEDSEELWDGVEVIGLLYPYEENFGPQQYEQVAQEVISVGNQIDEAMEKLEVLQEVDFESI